MRNEGARFREAARCIRVPDTSQAPVLSAFLAGVGTWAVTAAGAALAVARKDFGRRALDAMLGVAAGVMLAASFWSLLQPAIALSASGPLPRWLPAAIGFVAGGAALAAADKVLPHLHPGLPLAAKEGVRTSWRRATLLVAAITLHNVPEGLAVGVAFGAAAAGVDGASHGAAVALAIGIAIQNFPEGIAVALPLRREGVSRGRAFLAGQASALVEPVAAAAGAAAVLVATPLLPYALAFAAGAMVFVVVEELVPESQGGGNADLATMGLVAGFVAMMILDVAFSG